jgi:aryl-alcohol dehydrogenase-like predicted oxidoreductase
MTLPTRSLGRTGVEVTALGYGAMELRGERHRNARPLEPGQAARVLNAVLDSGITMIDTSLDYGASEDEIGDAIGHRRDEYFLASKCGCPVDRELDLIPGHWPHVFTRDNVRDGVHESLRRLKTDHLDLVQFHQSPTREVMETEGGLEALQELQAEGKLRFIGSSSTLPNMEDHVDMGVFDAFQVPWSLLDRSHENVIRRAASAGAGIIIRGGVARGEPGEGRGRSEVWQRWRDANLDELLDGDDPTQFVLRYTLTFPDMSTTIVGTSNVAHLQRNLEAVARGPLPDDVFAEASRRVEALDSQSGG